MAETQFKIAMRTGLSFKQAIDYCREIIQRYPNTKYAEKSRELLRQTPERFRKRWHVTDEEMGL